MTAPSPSEQSPERITLIGREGCHLCDDAREIVRQVADDTGAGWVEVVVDDDPDLLRRYSDQVPVVLVDGAQHDFWRVDEARLRAALARPPADAVATTTVTSAPAPDDRRPRRFLRRPGTRS